MLIKKISAKILGLAVLMAASALSPLANAATDAATKYPIILVHGAFGFDRLLGVVQYWDGIPQELRAHGAYVYEAHVSANATAEQRGEQLLTQVNAVLAATGAAKVNLIGHSFGGPTIRYVAAIKPEKVASLTTIGSPTFGGAKGPLETSDPLVLKISGAFMTMMSNIIAQLSGHPDLKGDGLGNLTESTMVGMRALALKYPNGVPTTYCSGGAAVVNGIYNYSWTGTNHGGTNLLDVSDPVLAIMGSTRTAASDAVVEQCDAYFGRVLKNNYNWNHLDETNMLFGQRDWFSEDPRAVIRDHAVRLKNAGL